MATPPTKVHQPIGQAWLRKELGLSVLPSATEAFLVAGARRSRVDGARRIELYPLSYETDGTVVGHLRFALKHEPLDLGIIAATMKSIDATVLEDWLRREPTGGLSRRTWFFFELFTGRTLDIPDARTGNYVEALDAEKHFVGARRSSARHRVADNLLGNARLCPTVRRTAKLEGLVATHIDAEARALVRRYAPGTLARALGYLHNKEARSSLGLDASAITTSRAIRLLSALEVAPKFDLSDASALIRLQGEIVDPRYAAQGWRQFQNFVGEDTGGNTQQIRYVAPRPEAVPELMVGWASMTERLQESPIDPVVAAAVSAFSFAFIRPFEDGNGRLQRYLVQAMLMQRTFGLPGMVYPISAAISRDQHAYAGALRVFSDALLPLIQWRRTSDDTIAVETDTDALYRCFRLGARRSQNRA
jgi:hypothetical protein